ncbi:MAG: hypothetical protein ACOYD9_08375 [Pyramidobacter sp.]|jgi:hypothetical protein
MRKLVICTVMLCFVQGFCAAAAVPQGLEPLLEAPAGEKDPRQWYAPEKSERETFPVPPFVEEERKEWKSLPSSDRQEALTILQSAAKRSFSAEALCEVQRPAPHARELRFQGCLLSRAQPVPQGCVGVKPAWSLFPEMTEVDLPALRREVESLLSGQYVPGAQPMIDTPQRDESLEKIRGLFSGAEHPTSTPLETKEMKAAMEKGILDSAAKNRCFAFLRREHTGLWTVKVVDHDGKSIATYYCPTANAIESDRLNDWMDRLTGKEKQEPWIETTPSGQMILHGTQLPPWEKATQKETLKAFTNQLMAALEVERAAVAAQSNEKEGGKQ